MSRKDFDGGQDQIFHGSKRRVLAALQCRSGEILPNAGLASASFLGPGSSSLKTQVASLAQTVQRRISPVSHFAILLTEEK
jgi:hypothetical protein